MAESTIDERNCVLCKHDFEESSRTTVGAKGLKTLLELAKERQLEELMRHLESKSATNFIGDVFVHHDCRRKFVKKTKKCEARGEPAKKKLRSSLPNVFDWRRDCFLCGKEAVIDVRHPGRKQKVFQVRTLPFREKILQLCKERNDQWSSEVNHRLETCIDLVAVEAVYHESCKVKFQFHSTPTTDVYTRKGRPEDRTMQDNFISLCLWIENEASAEPFTVSELYTKMEEIANGSPVYSQRYLKQKLAEHYKDFL